MAGGVSNINANTNILSPTKSIINVNSSLNHQFCQDMDSPNNSVLLPRCQTAPEGQGATRRHINQPLTENSHDDNAINKTISNNSREARLERKLQQELLKLRQFHERFH